MPGIIAYAILAKSLHLMVAHAQGRRDLPSNSDASRVLPGHIYLALVHRSYRVGGLPSLVGYTFGGTWDFLAL